MAQFDVEAALRRQCLPQTLDLWHKKLYPKAKENFIIALAAPGKIAEAIDEIGGVLRRRRHVKPSDHDNFGLLRLGLRLLLSRVRTVSQFRRARVFDWFLCCRYSNLIL